MRHFVLFGCILALLMGVTACAPQAEKKVWDIVWPLPPEEPRIRFVDILQSDKDVVKESQVAKILFGEDAEVRLLKPYGVAVGKDGKVYVSDIGKVFIFDRQNGRVDFLGAEAGTGKLRTPIGIAIAQDGRVFVTDTSSDRVFIYNERGNISGAIGKKGEFDSPSGIAIDEKRGRLYVSDAKIHSVRAYTLEGKPLFTIGERGGEPGTFNFPTNIALDSKGNLYVVDTGNFRVQVFDPDGKHLRNIGSIGDRPGNFSRPKGIAIDSEDHIYVVDSAYQNFQIFDKDGQLLLFVGEGGRNPGQFVLPAGIAIDSEDRIYVVDQLNSRVQIFEYIGEKWRKRQALTPKPVEKK